uniref:PHD finger protein ALFIN-LIKE n=1 Tax=Aegilops tauschii subsp. strangulata TaxID=200361 RepID=A0A453G6K9_AEGTS
LDAIAHAPMDGAGAGGAYVARTAEEVFRDLRGRRAGMIKALTEDVDKFFKLCDPGERLRSPRVSRLRRGFLNDGVFSCSAV